ncbi:hypothetical protein [Sorangium sp. So ce131]|uniref:hypothetical protein n=1 Tax=Sorangium sp. So ce131 TaxID=3133282 RepID=UPI003F601AB3
MRKRTTAELASVNVASLAGAIRRGEVDTDVEIDLVGEHLVLAGTISLPIETTRLASSGLRFWARCPGCSARVAVLYVDTPGLRCRRCAGLVKPSTRQRQQRPEGRVLEQAIAQRTRARNALGAEPDPREPIPPRPPYVSSSTWARRLEKLREADAAVQAALITLVDQIRSAPEHSLTRPASPALPVAPTPETPQDRDGNDAEPRPEGPRET